MLYHDDEPLWVWKKQVQFYSKQKLVDWFKGNVSQRYMKIGPTVTCGDVMYGKSRLSLLRL
jgi:hypothetical protein